MQPDRIAELLAPFLESPPCPPVSLTAAQIQQVATYVDLLLRWNARINLTAVRDADNIVKRHFGESFFAARQLLGSRKSGVGSQRLAAPHVIDVGSGAGFPGLPFKILAPPIALTLIESKHKKAAFLKEVVRTLALTHVDIFNGRAEEFSSTADLVTLRAVERYESALATAAGLVAPGGCLALLIGASQAERTLQLRPDFLWHPPTMVPQSESRVLLVGTNPPG